MSRHTSAGSRNHHISRIYEDCYRIYWSIDFYYKNSRLRHPRQFSRLTDRAGAEKFAKKWDADLKDQGNGQ